MDELETLKGIYLSDDVESEDYADNLAQITEWEKEIFDNENLKSWQEHEITKKIIKQAEESYISLSTQLITDRKLTADARQSIWGKQDACLWIIRVGAGDPKSVIFDIKKRIKMAINATK